MQRKEIIQNIFNNIGDLGRAAAGRMPQRLPGDMPTHAQLGLLFMVLHHGPQSVKDLSVRFHMTSSAVTQLVNGLVEEGLLLRREDVRDRRKTSLDLTLKGRKKVLIASTQKLKMIAEALKPLNDSELSQMHQIISKITSHLQQLWIKKPITK